MGRRRARGAPAAAADRSAERARARRSATPRSSALAQAAALVPGVSRHGAALTALRARGFAREDAHAISREASKPVLLGAAALKGWRIVRRRELDAEAVVAAAASAVSTAVAARVLAGRGLRAPLWPYAVYRGGLAAAVLARAT